jgi:Ser/Thr protein kinase RdoA (MazF antagonist)
MRFIHQVLIHSRTHGFVGLPRLACTQTGETLLSHNGVWFEAQEWLTGGPRYQLQMSVVNERIPNTAWNFTTAERQAVTTALATFHASTATLQSASTKSSLHTQMLAIAEQGQSQAPAAVAICHAGSSSEDPMLVARWRSLLPIMMNVLQARLTASWEERDDGNVICHGDLWPDHVYFNSGAFRGFVDFGALAFTTPALDLAQLILHFGGWQSYDEVLAMYTNSRPLSTSDRDIIPIVALFDLVSEGYWSLGQLCNDSTPAHEQAAHRHNLRFFLPSAKALVKEFS